MSALAYVTRAFVKRDIDGQHYACLGTKQGFKCGVCKRGNLSLEPKRGQRCRVCHNRVSQVITNNDLTFPISLERRAP